MPANTPLAGRDLAYVTLWGVRCAGAHPWGPKGPEGPSGRGKCDRGLPVSLGLCGPLGGLVRLLVPEGSQGHLST
jgi:hypothetical protein